VISDCRFPIANREKTPTMRCAVIPSPLGPLYVGLSDRGVAALGFGRDLSEAGFLAGLPAPVQRVEPKTDAPARQLADELRRYFEGAQVRFRTKLDLRGTPFQLRVWDVLRRIPFGGTVSYAEVARRVGAPLAARAVGQAVGANPVPIVVPCHRVICSSGALGGFSGGVETKRWLLRHEIKSRGRIPRMDKWDEWDR
jgi:methylated-DNA-[protein]-cysteine S-methyltransferase